MHNVKVENYVFGDFTEDHSQEGSLLDNSKELSQKVTEDPGFIGVFLKTKGKTCSWISKDDCWSQKQMSQVNDFSAFQHVGRHTKINHSYWNQSLTCILKTQAFILFFLYPEFPSGLTIGAAALVDGFTVATSLVYWNGRWHSFSAHWPGITIIVKLPLSSLAELFRLWELWNSDYIKHIRKNQTEMWVVTYLVYNFL